MKSAWFSRLGLARLTSPSTHAATSGSFRRAGRRQRRPLCESLEGRQLLSIYTVSNTNDSGAGSLRQAIVDSNANPTQGMVYPNGSASAPFNVIEFDLPANSTISPLSPLPSITAGVEINGSNGLTLDGSKAGSSAVGLDIQGTNTSVYYLNVKNFGGGGVAFDGALATGNALYFDNIGPGNGLFGLGFEGGATV